MGWLRGALAAIGVCLAAIAVLALLIDREGVTRRNMKNLEPDIIVVLGDRLEPDGTASPVLRARVKHAVKRLTKYDVLLLSGGGSTNGRSEAAVARDLALELGVPPERCLLEEESKSLIQSAAYSAEIFRRMKRKKSYHHPVLVSDPYQLPRARRLFERYARDKVSTSPVLNSPRHVATRERIRWTLRELPEIVKDLVFTR